MNTATIMAGSDPAIEATTGYRWWITPTAVRSMANRCPGWLSPRAKRLCDENRLHAAAEEIKVMANRAKIVDTIVNDTAFMSSVVTMYGRSEKHQYRIMNGRDGDRCVFVCCENPHTAQMVMIMILHYTSDEVRAGTLPSR